MISWLENRADDQKEGNEFSDDPWSKLMVSKVFKIVKVAIDIVESSERLPFS